DPSARTATPRPPASSPTSAPDCSSYSDACMTLNYSGSCTHRGFVEAGLELDAEAFGEGGDVGALDGARRSRHADRRSDDHGDSAGTRDRLAARHDRFAAADTDRDDRRAGLEREVGDAVEEVAQHRTGAARSFGKDPHRLTA